MLWVQLPQHTSRTDLHAARAGSHRHTLQRPSEVYTPSYAVAIRQLSRFERDETETDRQRSILIKCLIALPINWIFTPIVITLIVNLNLYYSTGMVYFIFFLAITNAIIPPLLRYFDPWHLFRKLRALWKNRPCIYLAMLDKKM